jgi:indolepyruvate ferredoxin oxidoreductase beta subunit
MADIIIAGVGGQGTLLASKIIGNAAIAAGFDVKVSEVHGMSQRGGSVVTYVRYSKCTVESPIIERGQADIILAFEALEAYRSAGFLKKGGRMIINTQRIDPMPVITGAAEYPLNIMEKLDVLGIETIVFDAIKTAREAGSEKAVNVAMIGKMAKSLDISKDVWIEVIKSVVKAAFVEVNVKAFLMGYDGSDFTRGQP